MAKRFEIWGVEVDSTTIDWKAWFQVRSASQVARQFAMFGADGEKLCIADRKLRTITTYSRVAGQWIDPVTVQL